LASFVGGAKRDVVGKRWPPQGPRHSDGGEFKAKAPARGGPRRGPHSFQVVGGPKRDGGGTCKHWPNHFPPPRSHGGGTRHPRKGTAVKGGPEGILGWKTKNRRFSFGPRQIPSGRLVRAPVRMVGEGGPNWGDLSPEGYRNIRARFQPKWHYRQGGASGAIRAPHTRAPRAQGDQSVKKCGRWGRSGVG